MLHEILNLLLKAEFQGNLMTEDIPRVNRSTSKCQNKVITHRSGVVPEVDPELAHGPDDGHEALDGVAVDDWLILQALLP